MNQGKPRTRDAILDGADEVVVREGANALTLERVAAVAGISKGGLLYHFPSKDDLIAGMLARQAGVFLSLLAQELEEEAADTPGRWLRAYARTTAATTAYPQTISRGLLAAVAVNPDLLEPVRDRFAEWQTRAEDDGLDPGLATVLRLAIEGWWLTALLDFKPPDGRLRGNVLATIERLSSGGG